MLRPPPDRRSGYRVLLLTALAGAATAGTRVSARVGGGRPDLIEDVRARSPFDRRVPAAVAGRLDSERPDTLRAGGAASQDAVSLRRATTPAPAQEAAWARADWRDPSPHREYMIDANGQRLHVLDWGGPTEGGPTGPAPHGAAAPLVFLPGMSHTGHVFDALAPRFTDRHRVVALTLRGHGASSAPAHPYTVDSLAADVAAALPALGLRGAVLVGHSLGGHAANRAAILFPDVVAGAVYLDATKDTAGLTAARAMGPTRPAVPDSAWATRDRARATYRRLYFPFWSDAQEADFRTQRTAPEVPAMADLLAPGDWRGVRQPQLAVCALDAAALEFPWLAPAERRARRAEIARAVFEGFVPWERGSCARFAREAPRGTLAVVPESHHYVFLVSPEQTYRALRRWLGDEHGVAGGVAGGAPDTLVDASPHRVRRVAVRPGVQLEVLDWGGPTGAGGHTGGRTPALVFLAGFGNTAHVFDGFAPQFTDRHRVLAITRRGFGVSTLAPSGYDGATLAGDVLATLDSLGLTGANRPVLVAHSFGGAELNALTRLRPAAARGLVYLDAGFDFAELYADTAWTRVRIPRPPEPPGGVQSAADALAYGRLVTGPGYPAGEVLAQGAWGERLRAAPAFHADSLQAWLMRGTPPADLGGIRVPVLAVYGVPRTAAEKYPWVVGADSALRAQAERRFAVETPILARQRARFRREVTNARVVEIPGGRHFVFLTHPREVAAAIQSFVARLAARPAL